MNSPQKAEEPVKKEEAKKDAGGDKKEDAAAAEEKKPAEEAMPTKSVVARAKGAACACACACLAAYNRAMSAADCAYARVAALPWDLITNVAFTLGINFTIAFTLWDVLASQILYIYSKGDA